MIRASRLAPLLALLLTGLSPLHHSRADIAMTAQEVGGDVVLTYSGSIDLTGLASGTSSQIRGIVYPVNSLVEFGPGTALPNAANSHDFAVDNTTAPANIGAGGVKFATTFSGSYFSVHRNSIKLPLGYVSGTPISGTMRFPGATFSTMGLVATTTPYLWTLTNAEEVTLSFLDPVASNTALKKSLQQKLKNLQKQIQAARKKLDTAAVKRLTARARAIRARIQKL